MTEEKKQDETVEEKKPAVPTIKDWIGYNPKDRTTGGYGGYYGCGFSEYSVDHEVCNECNDPLEKGSWQSKRGKCTPCQYPESFTRTPDQKVLPIRQASEYREKNGTDIKCKDCQVKLFPYEVHRKQCSLCWSEERSRGAVQKKCKDCKRTLEPSEIAKELCYPCEGWAKRPGRTTKPDETEETPKPIPVCCKCLTNLEEHEKGSGECSKCIGPPLNMNPIPRCEKCDTFLLPRELSAGLCNRCVAKP